MQTIRVWDLPTRIFHWMLAACVVGLLLTANLGGNWMNWHLRLGYTVLSLLLFRFVWGLVGGHWSRFVQFFHGPSATLAYLSGQGRPEHLVGHNPLGAWAVFGLLGILLAQAGTGLLTDDEIAFYGPLVNQVSSSTVAWATTFHTAVGKWLVLGLVILHVLAIVLYRVLKQQRLTWSMVTGDKQVFQSLPQSRDTVASRLTALFVWGLCALGVYTLVTWGASA